MSRPIVYSAAISPPSRAVFLTAAALGIDVDFRPIDIRAGETHTEEFRKMNPQRTVPTMDDNGFIAWDSHAIMCYLSDKYGKDDSLYPKDLRRRTVINQHLHFETGVLFARFRYLAFPLFMGKVDKLPAETPVLLAEAFDLLNSYLEGKEWLAGDSYTLADISCVASVSTMQALHPIDNYPNIKAWLKRCEDTLPGYGTLNEPGNKISHDTAAKLISPK